jgi:predicted O-methyltransferase YrrM
MLDDSDYCDANNEPQSVHDQNYAETLHRLKRFGTRCSILRTTSADAAPQFADGSLDFVYIDARHYRAGIDEDLKLWAPKVRPGGILCGHEYLDGVLPSGRFEVKSAVDAWALERGLEIVTSGEPIWRSWFIRMPAEKR